MWSDKAVRQMRGHATKTTQLPATEEQEVVALLAEHAGTGGEAQRTWAKSALDATRKRAEGWRNGSAATLALVLGSLAIKPGEGLMKYQGGTRALLMLLVGASVLCALVAVYRLTRAANGPGWLLELPDGASAQRWIRRVAGARLDLLVGQRLWMASIVLFSAAVAVTWFQT